MLVKKRVKQIKRALYYTGISLEYHKSNAMKWAYTDMMRSRAHVVYKSPILLLK